MTNLTRVCFPFEIKLSFEKATAHSSKDTGNTCGCNLPLMKEVKGRDYGSVYTPDGLYVDDGIWTVFDNYFNILISFK